MSIFEFLTVFFVDRLWIPIDACPKIFLAKSIMNSNNYFPLEFPADGAFARNIANKSQWSRNTWKFLKLNLKFRESNGENFKIFTSYTINRRSKFHNKEPRKSPNTPKNKQKLIPEIMLDQPKFPAKIPIFKISAQITPIRWTRKRKWRNFPLKKTISKIVAFLLNRKAIELTRLPYCVFIEIYCSSTIISRITIIRN